MKNPIIPFYKQIDQYIVKAQDCYMFDADNKRYVDFESGDWAANIGHSNKEINRILKMQADILVHDGLRFRNRESEALSLKLLEISGITGGKCVFVNSGSEAVNLALTLAKKLTGRKKILKMDCSYLSAYGHGQISPDNTDLINIPMNDANAVSGIDFTSIAAFAFEPGNSSSMIRYPDEKFISILADNVKQNGGFLVTNEVTTGFGRTGKWFGFQYYRYKPDIMSVGKALGNGYPVSGVCISKEVASIFDRSPFRHAQSHQNDPLGCAIGLGVINFIESNNLVNRAYETGLFFREQLIELMKKHNKKIKEIRARGLMIGMETDSTENAEYIYRKLIEKGFLTGQKENVIRFMPPLMISKADILELVDVISSTGFIK